MNFEPTPKLYVYESDPLTPQSETTASSQMATGGSHGTDPNGTVEALRTEMTLNHTPEKAGQNHSLN